MERVDQQMMTPKAAPLFRPQRRRNALSLLCSTGAGCEGNGLRESPASSCVIADITPHSRNANRARGVAVIRSSEKQRAQGRPGARCTRGLVCEIVRRNAHEHTGSAETLRPSPRNGFTAYIALSLATGLSCHHRPPDERTCVRSGEAFASQRT